MLIYTVSIVQFGSLKHARALTESFHCFTFTCEEAANMLMNPLDLIVELQDRCDPHLHDLIAELLTIPNGVWVGFDC